MERSAALPEAGALLGSGLAHHHEGRLAEAAVCYRAVVAEFPGHADGLHLLGLALHQSGASAAALRHLEAACALRPDVAHFLANTGIACLAAGEPARAEFWLRKAVGAAPGEADTRHNLGLALLRQERAAAAEVAFRQCLALQPGAVDARINLGAALLMQGRAAAAEECLRVAVRRRPDNVAALTGLAAALAAMRQNDAAKACLRKALALRPEDGAVMTQLGNLLREVGELQASETLLQEAATRQPGFADAQCNLGNVLAAAGRLDAAEVCFHAALAIAPEHADAAFSLGTTLLLGGRLREGWAGFERRWARRGFVDPAQFAVPRWDGGATTGKRLLLHAEQGLGDTIQMARFIPAIAASHRVVLAVPAALVRLMAGLNGTDQVIAQPVALDPGEFDFACPMMSLPHVLGVELSALPGVVPYLHAAPARIAAWRARLADLPGMKVGIAWAGSSGYAADARRSIAADDFAALAGVAGVTPVSLQKGGTAPDAMRAVDWTDELTDMADSAALVAALDLVIAVDTAVAHLAGALGKPVWLLNRFDPCWRWMLGRDDSPWYPTLHQFRQPAPGDWGSVLTAVRRALAQAAMVWASSSAGSMVTPRPGPSGTWITPAPARSTSGQMSATRA